MSLAGCVWAHSRVYKRTIDSDEHGTEQQGIGRHLRRKLTPALEPPEKLGCLVTSDPMKPEVGPGRFDRIPDFSYTIIETIGRLPHT